MRGFCAAHGRGPDWHRACRACIEQLAAAPPDANVGFVYASDPLADALDLIVQRLREASGIHDWVGTGGAAVCAAGQEFVQDGAIVAMVGTLPDDGFRLFDGLRDGQADLDPGVAAWIGGTGVGIGVVHGDPRLPEVAATIARLSAAGDAFLVGGLSSARTSPMQIAGRATEGGVSGILIDAAVPVVTGLSQGCTPIGPVREVTASQGPWLLTLEGRPALEVLKEDIGEVLARNLERIGGFIHAALPTLGADRPDYVVRNLVALDPRRGIIAVGDQLRRGDPVMFVKRDAAAAQDDLRRMLADLRARTGARPIRGALYHTCVARGPHMFGPESGELRMIEEALGPVPLVGFFTNGEIFRDQLYSYSGVLTLFL